MASFKTSSIALDIGARFIKLVELKREKNSIILSRAGIKEIPQDTKLDRDKVVAQLISQLLSENKIKPRFVNISASGQSVFVRFVKLLQVKEDKLKQTMKFEAQNQIPFSLNEVMWDWSLLDKDKKDSKKAVIVAIKKNLVEEMISKLNAVKLSTELIDVAPVSVYNCMAFNEDYNGESLGAIVDIGARSTNFIIFNKGNIWIRSFPVAGERIEEAKEQGTGELLAEIERSIEYYFMQSGEDA
ncbi:MAG: pilus assembly protein PilM, partial [Candidatus Omnitrophota bacterium]|nr:pilus assembly protein PilM [Candidatus Omnitrophota bacterium]